MIITIENVNFSATVQALILYKTQFGTEYISDFMAYRRSGSSIDLLEITDRLLWAMAKAADDTIPDPKHWKTEDDLTNLRCHATEIFRVWNASFKANTRIAGNGSGKPFTTENLLAALAACNMDITGIKNLPLGFASDLLNEGIGFKSGGKAKIIRKATTEDVFGGRNSVISKSGIICD